MDVLKLFSKIGCLFIRKLDVLPFKLADSKVGRPVIPTAVGLLPVRYYCEWRKPVKPFAPKFNAKKRSYSHVAPDNLRDLTLIFFHSTA